MTNPFSKLRTQNDHEEVWSFCTSIAVPRRGEQLVHSQGMSLNTFKLISFLRVWAIHELCRMRPTCLIVWT